MKIKAFKKDKNKSRVKKYPALRAIAYSFRMGTFLAILTVFIFLLIHLISREFGLFFHWAFIGILGVLALFGIAEAIEALLSIEENTRKLVRN